jgi:hypothetical protein
MMASDAIAGICVTVLLALSWTNSLQLWHIYVLVTCLSVATAFQRMAYLSAIPQIVPKRYLGNANGMVQAANGLAQFIAPIMGVGLLAAVSLRGILSFDVASYAITVGVVAIVRFPATMAARRSESVRSELGYGFRFVLTNKSFRAMLIYFSIANLFLAPLLVLISPLVLSFSSLPSVAAVEGAAGAGLVVAGATMAVWGGPRQRRMSGVRVMMAVMGLFAVVAGVRPSLLTVGLGICGVCFSMGTINGIIMTIVQTKSPQRLQGRMFAVIAMITAVAFPFGFGVIAPYGPPIFERVTTAHGIVGTIARAVVGAGPHRGIGLLYVIFGVTLAVIALAGTSVQRLARFDAAVPDALPDDLLALPLSAPARTAGDTVA